MDKQRKGLGVCDSCGKRIANRNERMNYKFKGVWFLFHDHCYLNFSIIGLQVFCDKHVHEKKQAQKRAKTRKKVSPAPTPTAIQAEPSKSIKQQQLEVIILMLEMHPEGLARRELSEITGIPEKTLCFRIWDHLEGSQGLKGKPAIFYDHGTKIIDGCGVRRYKVVKLVKQK